MGRRAVHILCPMGSVVACPATFLPPTWFFFHFILNTCRQWMKVSPCYSWNRAIIAYFHKVSSSSGTFAPTRSARDFALPDPTVSTASRSHSCPPTLKNIPPIDCVSSSCKREQKLNEGDIPNGNTPYSKTLGECLLIHPYLTPVVLFIGTVPQPSP